MFLEHVSLRAACSLSFVFSESGVFLPCGRLRWDCALSGRVRRGALHDAVQDMCSVCADEEDGQEDTCPVQARLDQCTVPLSPVEVENLLWSIHLAKARGGSPVCQLADGCYAVLRDEAGMHPKLPGGYSILYLRHDEQRKTLQWSCSCPSYARALKRFGGKSMLGGAKLCPCGTMVLLARLASRAPSEAIGSTITQSVVGVLQGADTGSTTDSTTDSNECASQTAQGGVFYDVVDGDVAQSGVAHSIPSEAQLAKAQRASRIAKAILSGPRLPVLVPGGERARLHWGCFRSQAKVYGDCSEWRDRANFMLFPLKLQPLEVLQNPLGPLCPECPGSQVLLRGGEERGKPVWVLCGTVLEQRGFHEWKCSRGSQCQYSGLTGTGRFNCMGVPWTLATGFVNVQNSFFVDRLTIAEMYCLVFEYGNPVLVAAAHVASRACAFMTDVMVGGWAPPRRDWLHQMIYKAFWWVVCMTERQGDLGADSVGMLPEELPDINVLPDEVRQRRLLSEQELYMLCEERLVALAVGGCAVQQRLPVYGVPPIVHPGIRGTPRNTEFLKAKSKWSAQAQRDLLDLQPPTSKYFGPLSRVIADGSYGFDPHSLRDPRAGMGEDVIDRILKDIGAEAATNGASLAQKKAFLCCACFSLVNVGETDCHVFVQAVMGTGGLASMSCPHGYNYGWKFLLAGAESVRDMKDLLKSQKCWQPLTLMDVPCGVVAHMEASEPINAKALWGSKRGCWREFAWEPEEVDLSPIR